MLKGKDGLGVSKQQFGKKKKGKPHKNKGPKASHEKKSRGQGK